MLDVKMRYSGIIRAVIQSYVKIGLAAFLNLGIVSGCFGLTSFRLILPIFLPFLPRFLHFLCLQS
jgi:hypothetical protein